jgi:hypothetical protein
VPGLRLQAAVAVAPDQVLDDGAGFGHDGVAVLDHRRFAERVHGAQLRRRQHRLRVALVFLDLVFQAEFLQQPQDALGAGVVQVVDDDHGRRGRMKWR